MPTPPFDAPASRSLIAAFLLIVALGVLALVVQVEPRNGPSNGGVPAGAVATFGH
jgi:hypothetical protein